MTTRQFRLAKILIAIIIGIVAGQSIILNNFWLPISAVSLGIIAILILRGRVKEIMADERDYQIAGQAARYTLTIFSITGCILTFIFMSLRQYDPIYETIGVVVAYMVCFYLLTYSLIFNYFRKPRSKSKKIQFYIITIFVIIIFSIASLRLFSGDEDTWLCQNGQWIKHGNPDFPSPSTECLK